MQALVDSNYLLRDIVVGWPGSVHEAQVMSSLTLNCMLWGVVGGYFCQM